MPGARLRWTLIFTEDSIQHLAERNIEPEDVADAVFGRYGPTRVRRGGRGRYERWFVVAPLEGGELLTCVFRAATRRDLNAPRAFALGTAGEEEDPEPSNDNTRLCVSARLSDEDERRSYRVWVRSKGGR